MSVECPRRASRCVAPNAGTRSWSRILPPAQCLRRQAPQAARVLRLRLRRSRARRSRPSPVRRLRRAIRRSRRSSAPWSVARRPPHHLRPRPTRRPRRLPRRLRRLLRPRLHRGRRCLRTFPPRFRRWTSRGCRWCRLICPLRSPGRRRPGGRLRPRRHRRRPRVRPRPRLRARPGLSMSSSSTYRLFLRERPIFRRPRRAGAICRS